MENSTELSNDKLKSIHNRYENLENLYKDSENFAEKLREENSLLQVKINQKIEKISDLENKIKNEAKIYHDERKLFHDQLQEETARNERLSLQLEEKTKIISEHQNEIKNISGQFDKHRRFTPILFQVAQRAFDLALGDRGYVLIKHICLDHQSLVFESYHDIEDFIQAMEACGKTLEHHNLCRNFEMRYEADRVWCGWTTPVTERSGDQLNIPSTNLIIGFLWALLNTKTDQEWSLQIGDIKENNQIQTSFYTIDRSTVSLM